jgi:hypothetical protein
VRNPEFQLVAWTIKFYMQVETRLAASGRAPAGRETRTDVRTAKGAGRERQR